MGRLRKQKADSDGKIQPREAASKRTHTPSHPSGSAGSPYDATDTKTKTALAKPPKMNTQAGVKKSTGTRRGPSRASKKDPWDEEQLTTSTKSRIIDVDLVKLLANPKAWTCLDENEKKEVISLLPDDIQRHADPGPVATGQDKPNNHVIPPLPESFVRYSNNWRDAVRQFQLDLQAGRYDPEWQLQAAAAMEERAQGKFDKFKEEQFEEFWGQKQKLDHDVIAGESSKVKLGTLVDNGVVRVGDVWRYSRVFRRGDEKLLLEKEARIVNRDGSTLTFAIPPGQRVFSYNYSHLANGVEATKNINPDMHTEAIDIDANGVNNDISSPNQVSQEEKINTKTSPVTTSALSATTSGYAISAISAQPLVPNSKSATGYIQTTPPPITDTSVQSSTTAAEPDSMNVDNLEFDSMLPGIAEMASADSESELSSAIDISFPSTLADEDTTLPGTTSIDVGTTDSMTIVADDTFNHTPWSHQPSDVSMAVNGKGVANPKTQAKANDRQPNGSKEAALWISHSSENSTADDITKGNEPSAGTPSDPTKGTAAEPTNEAASATTQEPISLQAQETPLKDIIFSGVTGPGRLANKILEVDGRITEPPNGNAWKEFRCYRDNQDIGSLWECRQTWFVRRK